MVGSDGIRLLSLLLLGMNETTLGIVLPSFSFSSMDGIVFL